MHVFDLHYHILVRTESSYFVTKQFTGCVFDGTSTDLRRMVQHTWVSLPSADIDHIFTPFCITHGAPHVYYIKFYISVLKIHLFINRKMNLTL
jgi:hypothetical protein